MGGFLHSSLGAGGGSMKLRKPACGLATTWRVAGNPACGCMFLLEGGKREINLVVTSGIVSVQQLSSILTLRVCHIHLEVNLKVFFFLFQAPMDVSVATHPFLLISVLQQQNSEVGP